MTHLALYLVTFPDVLRFCLNRHITPRMLAELWRGMRQPNCGIQVSQTRLAWPHANLTFQGQTSLARRSDHHHQGLVVPQQHRIQRSRSNQIIWWRGLVKKGAEGALERKVEMKPEEQKGWNQQEWSFEPHQSKNCLQDFQHLQEEADGCPCCEEASRLHRT